MQNLIGLVREEQISQKRPTPEKYDPTLLPYETYKVDFEFFRLAFIALSPWGKGCQAEFLATQIFRVSNKIISLVIFMYLKKLEYFFSF